MHTTRWRPHSAIRSSRFRSTCGSASRVGSPTRARVTSLPFAASHGDRVARTLHSSRVRFASAASVAVGTAALATVLGISLANANNQVAHLQGAIAESAHAQIVAAMETQGHTFVTLTNVRHRQVAQFVLLPNGRGYLVTSKLPALPASETYQLWGVINSKTISLGLLGRAPHLATFTSAGASRPYQLGVTVEAAGGARQPHGPMLATGTA